MPHDMATATELPPAVPDAARVAELTHIGATLFGKGQLEPARLHFLAALALDPENYLVLQNLGAVLRTMGHYAAAASVARRSVLASKGNPFCASNLGVAQMSLRNYGNAWRTLECVTRMLPESGPSWHDLGLACYMMGQYAAALGAFDKAIALPGATPQLTSDRALTLLAQGRLQAGLKAYEVRWQILAKSWVWNLNIAEWQGEPVADLRILVHHEQGFGDSIMLARFLPWLVEQKADVTVALPRELVRLFELSFGTSMRVVALDDERLGTSLQFDYHVPFLSLMRHTGVQHIWQIAATPYLRADPRDAIVQHLPKAQHRIGLCWASGDHRNGLAERRRLVPVVEFLPLTEIPGVSVVALQKGAEARDISSYGMEGLMFDASPYLADFAATAAIIDACDVVISVDSAVAHLAGALGKPCALLSPFSRCWRWWNAYAPLKIEQTGAPWYNHMPIFSQMSNGSWQLAVKRAITTAKRQLGKQ